MNGITEVTRDALLKSNYGHGQPQRRYVERLSRRDSEVDERIAEGMQSQVIRSSGKCLLIDSFLLGDPMINPQNYLSNRDLQRTVIAQSR